MIYISQSLIKQMIDNGNVIDHCPAYLYYVHITKQYKIERTDAMAHGLLFEHKALSMPGRAPSVARDRRTGKKRISTIRTEDQAEIFKLDAKENYITVEPGINTQVTIVKRWEKDERVILKGVLDLFPTTFKLNDELELTIIDLKHTGNINNTFGKFCWGNPEAIDHIQGIMYWYLVQDIDFDLNDEHVPDNYLRDLFTDEVQEAIANRAYSFRYMIYDNSPNMNKAIIRVIPDGAKIAQMHESIRKSVSLLEEYNEYQWPTFPHNECKRCPVITCPDRQTEIII